MRDHPVDRDLETARTIGNWLERTADELTDNPTGRERTLDQVERTSQRSARWLPPVYPGGISSTFTATRLVAAAGLVIIFAGLVLMSLGPRDDAALVGPAGETASPSAQTTEASALSAYVDGHFAVNSGFSIPGELAFGGATGRWDGDVYQLRDGYELREGEWSDGRLPPEMQVWMHQDEYVLDRAHPSRRGGASSGRVWLEDDQGSWAGELQRVFPYDDRYMTEWFTLTGSGAYAGLYAVLVAEHWYDSEAFEYDNEVAGLIAEGEPPPARPLPPDEGRP